MRAPVQGMAGVPLVVWPTALGPGVKMRRGHGYRWTCWAWWGNLQHQKPLVGGCRVGGGRGFRGHESDSLKASSAMMHCCPDSRPTRAMVHCYAILNHADCPPRFATELVFRSIPVNVCQGVPWESSRSHNISCGTFDHRHSACCVNML